MTVMIGRFEMPKRVLKDEGTAINTFCRFVVDPLEPGYGQTLGNSLRRVLLSSMEGAAITAVKIKGVFHEFCSIPGVVEDVTDIILNLKKVLLKLYTRGPHKVRIFVQGPGEITAECIETDNSVEVMNPTHYIATLSDKRELEIELEVNTGRGFVPADWYAKTEREIGVIPIDCLFSPVRRVNFLVENTRVGRRTDYEKLILEVWTDERMIPEDALIRAGTILRHHLDVFVNYDEDMIEFQEKEKRVDHDKDELRKKLNMSVNEIELSVRAANCLNNANILTVGQLVQKTESDMLKYRNFGKKSLREIEQKLIDLGLSLGSTFDQDLLEPLPKDEAKAS